MMLSTRHWIIVATTTTSLKCSSSLSYSYFCLFYKSFSMHLQELCICSVLFLGELFIFFSKPCSPCLSAESCQIEKVTSNEDMLLISMRNSSKLLPCPKTTDAHNWPYINSSNHCMLMGHEADIYQAKQCAGK